MTKKRADQSMPNEPSVAEFGARLRLARDHAGWKVTEAAELLGIAPARIHEWEGGRSVPRVTAVIAMIVTLGLDFETVFPEGGPRGEKRKNSR